jgi:hypothetical protein
MTYETSIADERLARMVRAKQRFDERRAKGIPIGGPDETKSIGQRSIKSGRPVTRRDQHGHASRDK